MTHKKYVISDLHLGHANILKYTEGYRKGTNVEEHDQWIIDQWNSVVTKNDLVYVLGDVAMNKEALHKVKKLKGNKQLIIGNHDIEATKVYLEYFQRIYGIHNYRRTFWMTHAPLHPNSLRGLHNLHGHVHQNSVTLITSDTQNLVKDERYINCCVEMTGGIPQDLDALYEKYNIVKKDEKTIE